MPDLSRVPARLRAHVFKPGQSGNPGGRSKKRIAGDLGLSMFLLRRLLRELDLDDAISFHDRRHRYDRGWLRTWLAEHPKSTWPTHLERMFDDAARANVKSPGALKNVLELARAIFSVDPAAAERVCAYPPPLTD